MARVSKLNKTNTTQMEDILLKMEEIQLNLKKRIHFLVLS